MASNERTGRLEGGQAVSTSGSVTIPSRDQLLLPLLETVHELGGSARPPEVIEKLTERFALPDEIAKESQLCDLGRWGTRRRYPWRQTVHWVRQEAAARGLIDRNTKGVWVLTELAIDQLCNCRPGLILVVYETPSGEAVWADAITAAGALKDGSINLLFSSPPYPVLSGRRYGVYSETEVIDLVLRCATDWKRALTDDGSIVLNFKDVWLPKAQTGGAVRSVYQEKLLLSLVEDVGLFFADRLYWRNPSHTPESFWTTVAKVRLNQDTEHLFWLSKSANPKARSERIMVPPKPSTIETYLRKSERASRVGPSGQNSVFEEQVAAIHAGEALRVIHRNTFEFANSDNHTVLRRALTEARLPQFDAMMPLKLAERVIEFLTDSGDTVYDPFFHSGTTGLAAEQLGRRWVGSDRSLGYVLGSALRFNEVKGYSN